MPVLATSIINDGLNAALVSGVLTMSASTQATGPFAPTSVLLDSATGTTMATIKKVNETAVAGDTALVVGINPLSNRVTQTGVWTSVISGTAVVSGTVTAVVSGTVTAQISGGTSFISGGNLTAVVSGTTFISGGTLTAVLTSTVISGGVVTASINQGGAAISSTNGIFANLVVNNALVSASAGVPSMLMSGATTVAVKGANLSAVAADAALVVALSPNNINANGQTTMANSAPIVIASDQSRIAVSPPLTLSTTNTPTLSTTTAYTSAQVIGGILTFTAVLGTTTSGIIQSITCKLNTGLHTVGLSVSLFKASATAGTYTDHLAVAINTADVPNLIGTYRLSTALSDVGNMAIYNLDGIGKAFQGGTSNLYGVVTALGTTLGLGNVTAFSIELAVLPS